MTIEPLEKPAPAKINMRGICESYGHPEYYAQLANRMRNKVRAEPDGRFALHTFVDLENEDVYLDKQGILIWDDMLKGYFDEEWLDAMFDCVFFMDKEAQLEFEAIFLLQRTSSKTLRSWLKEDFSKHKVIQNSILAGKSTLEKTEQSEFWLKGLIKDELDRRKHPKAWIQWLHKIFSGSRGVYL